MGSSSELEFLEAEVLTILELCLLLTVILLVLMGLKKFLKHPIKHKLHKNHSQSLD